MRFIKTNPKTTKFLKSHQISVNSIGSKVSNRKLCFGSFGIKSLESGYIRYSELEAVRKKLVKSLKNKGKVWLRVFPNLGITKKPVGIRMGKGKGAIDSWVGVVKEGFIIFEVEIFSMSETDIRALLNKVKVKIGFKTQLISKKDNGKILF